MLSRSEMEDMADRLLDVVELEVPKDVGVAVLLFQSDPRSRQTPISLLTNAELPTFLNALRELLARHSS